MRLVRLAVANATTGACRSHVDTALAMTEEAARDGATLVAFPKEIVGGYPREDLVQWRVFVGMSLVLGDPEDHPDPRAQRVSQSVRCVTTRRPN